jgi:hypothetical protein
VCSDCDSLHTAVTSGHAGCLRHLLQQSAATAVSESCTDETDSLLCAVVHKNLWSTIGPEQSCTRILKVLLDCGEDPEVLRNVSS